MKKPLVVFGALSLLVGTTAVFTQNSSAQLTSDEGVLFCMDGVTVIDVDGGVEASCVLPPPVTTVPETTTTIITIPETTTTTTVPDTTTTQPPETTTTTTQPPETNGFFEDFSNNGGLENFRSGVFHRGVDTDGSPMASDTWSADHDPALAPCGNPNVVHHTIDKLNREDSLFVCNDHLMTSMGDVDAYSVVWFSPNYAGTVSRVCWDASVSIDIMGDRQWWEVMLVPVDGPDLTAINWLAGTAHLPSYGESGAVVFGFGPDNMPHPSISVGNTRTYGPWPLFPSYGSAYTDPAQRVPHCFIDNGDGTLTYETRNADGSLWTFNAEGSFPAGPLKVVFKDHNYTPDKACESYNGLDGPGSCGSYTWHWDNISVES